MGRSVGSQELPVAFAPSRAVNDEKWGQSQWSLTTHKKIGPRPNFALLFLFFFSNVMGIGIRVSEQDCHCLFRPKRSLARSTIA